MNSSRFLPALLNVVILAGATGCGDGESPAVVAPVTTISSIIDNGVQQGLDGVWVYIDDGSGGPLMKTAGVQDRSNLTPAQDNSLLKIASISKMFIAVSAVRLVETGTLRLDDTLEFWLPSVASGIEYADSITIRNLLQHRSGIPDFDSQPGFSWSAPHTDPDALLALVEDQPADFLPDSRYAYSNTNYLLLGRILDIALGYPHRDFVNNEILMPLGLLTTFYQPGEADVALLARGYWNGVDRTDLDYAIPGGSMLSTAADTGKFLRALATGTLLSPQEKQLYRTLFNGYGHSGWLPGYQARAYYHADIDTVVVQLVNTTGGNSETVSGESYELLLQYLRSQ